MNVNFPSNEILNIYSKGLRSNPVHDDDKLLTPLDEVPAHADDDELALH